MRYALILIVTGLLLSTPAFADSTLIFAVSNPIDSMGGIVNQVGQVALLYTNIFFDQMHLYISSAAGQPVLVTELAVHDFRAPGVLSIVSLDDAGTLTYLYRPSLFDGGSPDAPLETITRTFDPGPSAVTGNYSLTVENNAVCCGHSLYRVSADPILAEPSASAVPEPATALLLFGGLLALGAWRHAHTSAVLRRLSRLLT